MALHDKQDLLQRQALPLRAKILMTERRIREWVDHWNGDVYVSFSGGKDSTVLKHIVDQMYDNIPAVFVNTGLEYPEIQQFVREVKAGKYGCFTPDVEIIRPEMRFDEVIRKYGYPVISKEISQVLYEARVCLRNGKNDGVQLRKLRGQKLDKDGNKSPYNLERYAYLLDAPFSISHKCCDVMKKKPVKQYEKQTGRKAILGTMASESLLRTNQWYKHGCNAFESSRPISTPLSFWTEQDVLQYLKEFNVPFSAAYGELRSCDNSDVLETTGLSRTGCMFCAFGMKQDGCPNRFQRMKITHPKQYEYCMTQLGLKEVLEYIDVPYE